MAKTITVTSRQMKEVPKYFVGRPVTTKYLVHDEFNQAKEGDKVHIVHSKPFSKRKHYQLHSIERRILDEHGKGTSIERIEIPPIGGAEESAVLGELEAGTR